MWFEAFRSAGLNLISLSGTTGKIGDGKPLLRFSSGGGSEGGIGQIIIAYVRFDAKCRGLNLLFDSVATIGRPELSSGVLIIENRRNHVEL